MRMKLTKSYEEIRSLLKKAGFSVYFDICIVPDKEHLPTDYPRGNFKNTPRTLAYLHEDITIVISSSPPMIEAVEKAFCNEQNRLKICLDNLLN